MDVIERAQRDLDRGQPSMARDRLAGVLGQAPTDQEVLVLLARTRAAMHDLPAVGAAWFLTDRGDDDLEARTGLAALHARYPRSRAVVGALPVLDGYAWDRRSRPVRTGPARRRLDEWQPESTRDRVADAVLGVAGLVLLLAALVLVVVGAVTVVGWVL